MQEMVGDIRGVVVLDIEGRRIIGKYFNTTNTQLETNASQKQFERQLFLRSNRQTAAGSKTVGPSGSAYENDIMIIDSYVAVFRCYSDMTCYILGCADDNELILGQAMDCLHECLDKIFKGNIERKSLINTMSVVILLIDEMIDTCGILMHTDSKVIRDRIATRSKAEN